ncbi:MAG: SDR family oxidoreductase [Acidobacteria bacterium]|nr:SDR family oxidoreductase [Acidobacteriota bacterium]
MSSSPFAGARVVLTGASTGIGRAMALELAGAGARLVLAARGRDALEAVAARCRELGTAAEAVPTDVGDEAAARRLIERAVELHGGIDMLVNNAGRTLWSRFDELETLEPFRELMRVNYFGSVYCTYHALPHLKASRGRLVAVSSLTGKTGVPTRSGYAATKHAMAGFFDSLRIELAGSGVSVTVAYPDFVASETRKNAFGPDGRPLGESPVAEGKVMTAERCARLILRAAAARRREVIPSFRGRFGQWLKLLSPALVDRIARRAIARGR